MYVVIQLLETMIDLYPTVLPSLDFYLMIC